MKNPQNIFIPKNGSQLVKFAGFIVYVDKANPSFNRLCFKTDTRDKDSDLVSVTAFAGDAHTNRPDYKSLTDNAQGRFAVVIASKSTVTKDDGRTFDNYILQSIDFAPVLQQQQQG